MLHRARRRTGTVHGTGAGRRGGGIGLDLGGQVAQALLIGAQIGFLLPQQLHVLLQLPAFGLERGLGLAHLEASSRRRTSSARRSRRRSSSISRSRVSSSVLFRRSASGGQTLRALGSQGGAFPGQFLAGGGEGAGLLVHGGLRGGHDLVLAAQFAQLGLEARDVGMLGPLRLQLGLEGRLLLRQPLGGFLELARSRASRCSSSRRRRPAGAGRRNGADAVAALTLARMRLHLGQLLGGEVRRHGRLARPQERVDALHDQRPVAAGGEHVGDGEADALDDRGQLQLVDQQEHGDAGLEFLQGLDEVELLISGSGSATRERSNHSERAASSAISEHPQGRTS